MTTAYVSVNEGLEPYETHATLEGAQATQAAFPNDLIAEVSTPHSYYEPGRSRAITYYLEPKPAADGEKSTAVQVSVSHDKSRKRFTAQAWRVTIEKSHGFTSTCYDLFAGVTLATQPVARFSAKALEAFTEQVLASVPDYAEASEKFAAMFAPVAGEG